MEYKMSSFIVKYFERYAQQYLHEDGKALTARARLLYNDMMHTAPDVGKNSMTFNLALTVAFFAYYEASEHRINGEAIDILMNWLVEDYRWLTKLTDMNRHSYVRKLLYKSYGKYAAQAEQHKAMGQWSGAWSMQVNPDNRQEGIYYQMSNCPLYAFARTHGYEDMMPYICKFDYIFEKMLHAKLIRTETETSGGAYCDTWLVPDQSELAKSIK